MAASANKFRDTFKVSKEIIHWYPGHMKFSFQHMQAKMRVVDCIVEVHDSRIPFSGRNPLFVKSLAGTKPHILVLNKLDLIDKSQCETILSRYEEDNERNVIFVNSLDQKCKGLKKIVPLAVKLVQELGKVPMGDDSTYHMMIVGVPNVGKSSLINALRNVILHKGKATAVGGVPGVTKSVQNKIKVHTDPPMYLIDTPGILLPNILDVECGMKLALCSCIKDDIVGIITIADFLLYWLNKTENFKYVKVFGLQEPTDTIFPLLIKIANDYNKKKKVRSVVKNKIEVIPDVNFGAIHFVQLFRQGEFGDIYLDKEYL